MTIKKFQAFQLKNTEVCNDLMDILNEGADINLTATLINSSHESKKLTKALDLMLSANLVTIIQKDYPYKKLCQKTSMLIDMVEKRKYYQLEELL